MKYPTPPKAPAYQPEKPNHKRTVTKTLILMLAYHVLSMLVYRLFAMLRSISLYETSTGPVPTGPCSDLP